MYRLPTATLIKFDNCVDLVKNCLDTVINCMPPSYIFTRSTIPPGVIFTFQGVLIRIFLVSTTPFPVLIKPCSSLTTKSFSSIIPFLNLSFERGKKTFLLFLILLTPYYQRKYYVRPTDLVCSIVQDP